MRKQLQSWLMEGPVYSMKEFVDLELIKQQSICKYLYVYTCTQICNDAIVFLKEIKNNVFCLLSIFTI